MKRRAFLGASAAVTTGLAGCSGVANPVAESPTERTPVATPSLAEQGSPPSICQQGYVDLGIYAIDEPAFADDWSGVEIPEKYTGNDELVDDDVVIGLARGDDARAYPLAVLWVHEIVNDTFGQPLIVTYCSLCRSGMVARRVVDGTPTRFGVSGQLWRPPELQIRVSEAENRTFAAERRDAAPGSVRSSGNLVMFDLATTSYWSQILARAICGPRSGDRLEIVPSTVARWSDWRAAHPDTDVLLPPPRSTLMELPG